MSAPPASAVSATTTISAGYSHACMIRSGKAYCWGDNAYGELGDNSAVSSGVPVAVYTGGVLSGVTLTQIVGGHDFTCALGAGAVYCWGYNNSGQLGNNSTSNAAVPVAVTTSGTPMSGVTVTQVSAGYGFACAVGGGAAYCWGTGGNGELGNNSTSNAAVPVAVTTSGTPMSGVTVTQVTAGPISTCAVGGGAAYCWGYNGFGQLGNNSTTQSTVPVAVSTSGVLSGKTVTGITGGTNFMCALSSAGAAYCWGGDGAGQLGNNSTTESNVPVAVSTGGVLSGVTLTQISSGQDATCAVGGGAAYCWGNNPDGQLGNNSTTQSTVPVAVSTSGVLSGKTVTQVDGGQYFACALDSLGAAYCWGLNSSAQAGNTDTAVNVKVPVVVGPSRATTIGAGSSHSCVIRSGKAYCWGDNTYGQLGNGTMSTTPQTTQVAVYTGGALSGVTLTQIAAGTNFTCALSSTGVAYCWGQNNDAQLGADFPSTENAPVAVTASGVLSGVILTEISSSDQHSCALSSTGSAYCWGYNGDGELGQGNLLPDLTPVAVTAGSVSGKALAEVSVGHLHSCAVDAAGLAYCWGDNSAGEIGDNTITQRTAAVAVYTACGSPCSALAGKYLTEITGGANFTCALDSTGLAYCWGSNATYGELGNGNFTEQNLAVAVTATGVLSGVTLTQIGAGAFSACVLSTAGASYCWGNNADGEFGSNNFTSPSTVPVATYTGGALSGLTIIQLTTGYYHTCVLDDVGTAYCSGLNSSGQLGNNSTTKSSVAVQVLNLAPGAPTGVTAFPASTTATVYWVAPASLGTGTLTGYTATASPGGATCTTSSTTTCTITGLSNGTTYTVTVVTNTTDGDSNASAAATVTPWTPQAGIEAGNQNSCAISAGLAYCWGDNTYGELGNNTTTSSNTAVAAYTGGVLSGKTLTQITAGYQHTCVLASTGVAYCWGYGLDGELGNGGTASSSVPVAVTASGVLSGVTLTQISAGKYFTCALGSNGAVYCWGLNSNGQLGNGSTTASSAPVAVTVSGVLSGKTLTNLAVGAASACVLASTGLAYCWGDDTYGQLGNNTTTTTPQTTAVAVTASGVLSGKTLAAVQGGYFHYCALASTGVAYCWGYGLDGELGNGGTASSSVPVAVTASGVLSGKTLVQLTGGQSHACALDSAGAAYCWGLNTSGQLGINSVTSPQTTAATVYTGGMLSGKIVYQVGAGRAHTCVADSTGTTYCWGLNSSAQVGDGTTTQRNAAVLVGPQAPTGVGATPGDTTAAVSWTAPAYLNNGALTGYTATASPGGATCTTTGAASCTITGLTDGTTYTITVTTTASTGTSAPSTGTAVVPVGFLTLTSPSSLTWAVTGGGSDQSAVDTVSGDQQLTATDNTVTGAGWHITVSATTFTSGTHTLPSTGAVTFTGSVSSLGSTAPSATCVGSCTLPTDTTTYPVAINTAASSPPTFTIYDTSAATGEGSMTIGGSGAAHPIGWWIQVPASAYAGSYTSTLALAVVSGP